MHKRGYLRLWAWLGVSVWLPTGALAQEEIELFGPSQPATTSSPKAATTETPSGIKVEAQAEAAKPRIEVGSSGALWDEGNAGSTDGSAVIRFKRQGLSMFVEAKLQGKLVYFMLDTGANYTAIRPSVARAAGIYPPSDAPVTTFHTANGPVAAPFGLIPSMILGGRRHSNVTYSLCETCGADRSPWGAPIAGLLGMNVLRRYTMRIDEARGVLELQPSLAYHDRMADVRPWLEPERPTLKRKTRNGPRVFEVKMRNRAPQRVDGLRLVVECGAQAPQRDEVRPIDARSSRALSITLDERCQPADWSVEDVRW